MLSTFQAKLLIVDDLPENLLALEALIKREDRQVFKALSADEALSPVTGTRIRHGDSRRADARHERF